MGDRHVVRIEPERVRSAARHLNALRRGPLHDAGARLAVILRAIEAAWSGAAGSDFQRLRARAIEPWLHVVGRELDQASAYLDRAATAYLVTDEALAREVAESITPQPGKPPGLARSLPAEPSDPATYVVVPGDTLWDIGRRYGTTVEALRAANGITGHLIFPGQILILPPAETQPPPEPEPDPAGSVIVKSGDTLWAIARAHGLTVAELMRANGLTGHLIFPGQRLILSRDEDEDPVAPPAPTGDTAVLLAGAYISGYTWLAHPGHYAVDLNTPSVDKTLRAPYPAALIVADACPALTAHGNPSGQLQPGTPIGPDNNWGYGAMAVVETRYEDLTAEQLQSLVEQGARLEPGQSLYVMTAHLRPDQVPAALPAAAGLPLNAGDAIAVLGTSGNSTGPHVHVEAAVAASGLRPGESQNSASFWIGRIVGVSNGAAAQGARVDPTPLFVGAQGDE